MCELIDGVAKHTKCSLPKGERTISMPLLDTSIGYIGTNKAETHSSEAYNVCNLIKKAKLT